MISPIYKDANSRPVSSPCSNKGFSQSNYKMIKRISLFNDANKRKLSINLPGISPKSEQFYSNSTFIHTNSKSLSPIPETVSQASQTFQANDEELPQIDLRNKYNRPKSKALFHPVKVEINTFEEISEGSIILSKQRDSNENSSWKRPGTCSKKSYFYENSYQTENDETPKIENPNNFAKAWYNYLSQKSKNKKFLVLPQKKYSIKEFKFSEIPTEKHSRSTKNRRPSNNIFEPLVCSNPKFVQKSSYLADLTKRQRSLSRELVAIKCKDA
ncbi:unnamed protein product [Blepharisma stoltei]|uniref:Uncharacterized protein n=1 Tax=Blepharisma stoltei TaxID=1481888 RepID=A0AAU9JCB6_9CILI|nr:unnamed protein product [Blepharisma stoltei]